MFQKSRKFLGLVSILSVALFAFSACVEGTSTTDETVTIEGTVKVGAIMPLTGDAAAYGVPLQKVAEIALAKSNAAGGVEMEFIWEDGKCNGQDAASAVQKLINVDGVQVIYGAFCSSETLGGAPIAEAAGVVMISPGSSSPDITNAGDYIFRNYPSDSSQAKVLGNLASFVDVTKLGTITEENDYTIGLEKVFIETFEENGGEVVTESFLPTDTDFKTQIAKLKGEGINGIFINPQTPPKADLILKQLQELGLEEGTVIFVNDVIMGYQAGIDQYTDLLEGAYGAQASYDANSADFQAMENEYAAANNGEDVPFKTYAATSYDAVFLIAEALNTVGNNADAIRDWLYDVNNWPGTAGLLTLDENGDPASGHKAQQIVGGETVDL